MTNRLYLIFLSSILIYSIAFAQKADFTLSNCFKAKAVLYQIEGEKTNFVDSIIVKNQHLSYNFVKNNSGLYRLQFSDKKWLDFVYDGTDVKIKTDINAIYDSLVVIESKSNKLFYQFLKLNKDYKTKSELLNLILIRYPLDDSYYKQTQVRLNELQNEYYEFVNVASQSMPSSFISRYISSSQLPVIDQSIPPEKHLGYLKEHSLDNVDFNNAGLINSDCFTNKAIEYLTYFRNPQLPKELLEKEFQKAVDTILTKASVNILVYQHLADYLITGFKKFGFNNVVDYVVENYVVKDDLCLDEATENSIQNRINQSKLLAVGSAAPDQELKDVLGNLFKLTDIKTDKILLVFYASWCPHCQDLLPQLSELYNNQSTKEFEVVAISLDESKKDWEKLINDINAGWLNSCDGLGWDSPAAKKYFVYATPTIFVLDNKLKILAKPLNIAEVKKALQ